MCGAGGGGGRGERDGRERGGGSWTRAAYNIADDAAEIDERMVLQLIQSRDEVSCCVCTSVCVAHVLKYALTLCGGAAGAAES